MVTHDVDEAVLLSDRIVMGMAGMRTPRGGTAQDRSGAIRHHGVRRRAHGNYNRIMLSPGAVRRKDLEEIMLNDEPGMRTTASTLHKGKQVVDIDRAPAAW
jgi:NAD(P)H-nitrite reductase large subunit